MNFSAEQQQSWGSSRGGRGRRRGRGRERGRCGHERSHPYQYDKPYRSIDQHRPSVDENDANPQIAQEGTSHNDSYGRQVRHSSTNWSCDTPSTATSKYGRRSIPITSLSVPTPASTSVIVPQPTLPTSPHQQLTQSAAAAEWSAKVWRGVGFSGNKAYTRNSLKQGVEQTSAITIGLGRATGLSRVPDQSLADSPALIQHRLKDLLKRVEELERFDCSVVSSKCDVLVDASVSGKSAALFEAILADFRELTMAVTASSLVESRRLSIEVYEAAADASLLGGNLDFYLVCQTRLLRDLYEEYASDLSATARRDEFLSYSLLYFGIFSVDGIELATKCRRLSKKMLASPYVRYSFAVISAFRIHDSCRMISLYKEGNVRQRTILHPALKNIQELGLKALIKTYLQVSRPFALSLLGITSDDEFLRLLETQRPDLIEFNQSRSPEFSFRPPRVAK